MDQDDKRRFQERAQRASKKHKTLAELKLQKEEARRRRARRRKPSHERWRADDEEQALFEKLGPRRERAPRSTQGAANAAEPPATLEVGLVVGVARGRVRLECGSECLPAVLLPTLELAVGDRVGFERRAGGLLLVRELHARSSWLARPDPAHPQRRLVLAANVELVLCVVAAREPRWKPGFVDRVLLAAEEGRARVRIVVNKVDLLAAPERAALTEELAPYAAIGAEALCLSAASGEGLELLRELTRGRTCAFVGPSGVGKSSLLNALDPSRTRATGAVRASDGKGRHTTSAAELVTLANGARLIDTPGVRQFGLLGLERRALASYFPEFAEFARHCRFRDCSHRVEPACAVRAAAQAGAFSARRFATYARIHASLGDA
ncbi:MAG: ribosome small subunit-dependent GTPase A [Planctomycetes bacterium]|nr:ribosome small subunit-dependent GTPase A [Planctomycetota bacterium]